MAKISLESTLVWRAPCCRHSALSVYLSIYLSTPPSPPPSLRPWGGGGWRSSRAAPAEQQRGAAQRSAAQSSSQAVEFDSLTVSLAVCSHGRVQRGHSYRVRAALVEVLPHFDAQPSKNSSSHGDMKATLRVSPRDEASQQRGPAADVATALQLGLDFDLSRPIDCSIAFQPRAPAAAQFQAFGLPPARAENLLSVERGHSVNCDVLSLCVHGSGTHVECVGHIARREYSLLEVCRDLLSPMVCLVLTVDLELIPVPGSEAPPDRCITAAALDRALSACNAKLGVPTSDANAARSPLVQHAPALAVRTGHIDADSSVVTSFTGTNPPYFAKDAMVWVRRAGVRHLLCDLPSVDREQSGEALPAHRTFFGSDEEGAREGRTVTEYVRLPRPQDFPDDVYVLYLGVANVDASAAPARPVLYPRFIG